MKKIILITVLFLSTLSLNRCTTDYYDYIPYTYVNLNLNLSTTQFLELNTIGNHVYLTGGYNGLVVYRVSTTDFVCFDRTCPYDVSSLECRVVVDPSGLLLIDSCCMSKWLILDGSVVEGPAVNSLRPYNTSFDGTYLHIYN